MEAGAVTTNMPARMLRLLSLLQGRREWSGAELAERLGVAGRTVRRDIERLRELGYPVEGTTGTAGGYRLASGKNLPPLLLDDEEAVAVAVGLRTATSGVSGIEESSVRALAKLEQVLPSRLRQRVTTLGEATVHLQPRSGPRVDPAILTVLAVACRDRELLSFDYRSRDEEVSGRRAEPHHLVTVYGRWYLVAFDRGREDWRTFRVDRVAAPVPSGRRFEPRPLPAGDPAGYVAESIAAAPYRYAAVVTVRAPAEQVSAALYAPLPRKVEPLGERECRLRLGADSLAEVFWQLAGVLGMGAGFTVEGSAEVLDYLRAAGQRLSGSVPG
ncbi:helix-turn-helix transcriptional regulator [Amycolatopsis aidingensis]|uniref:helix-turn-helix transcriptional regulator n=1 Tax=Amycolatopsis aidingensis TaxID=2842453 RepID=UPI0038CBF670